jgi:branched-chain amino acid transport system ATP-binding protein
VLEVLDLHAGYGAALVVQGVSLTVGRGQTVVVLGRNGVGKTTLVRALAGLTPPRAGHVRLDGEDITGLPAHVLARRGVGLVPQGRRLFASLTVGEHLAVAARPGGGWTVARVLALFPPLAERLGQRGQALSGGEQGMLAVARALVGNPRVLLMDEPSEGLAPRLGHALAGLLADLKRGGASILLVEQNLAFALRVADQVLVMNKGRIVWEGTPQALRADEATRARWLGV